MERGAGRVTCSEDSCSTDEPLRESLKRSGELNSCGRRNNCKDPKTEEIGIFEGLQSGKCLEPRKDGIEG